jgi:hypothetical protein
MIQVHRLYSQSNIKSDEAKQAQVLAEHLEEYLPPESEGDIYLLPSMTCPKAKNKDIDLVMWIDSVGFEVETNAGTKDDPYPLRRKIIVKDVLVIFEIKSHNTYNSMKIQQQKLYVKYGNEWHNATEQSNGQKHALIDFLTEKTGSSPFVVNLIWLFKAQSSNHQDNHSVENILWGFPNWKKLFEVVFRQNLPRERNGQIIYQSSFNDEIKNDATSYFEVLRKNTAVGIGRISRKKVQEIIKKDIADSERNYLNSIGNKLTIIKGNPGTGKTIHLIHLANNLSKKRDMRCLILTFNKPLQQDIKRLLFHSGISQTEDIEILTWNAFTYRCLKEYEDPTKDDYDCWTDRLHKLTKGFDDAKSAFETVQEYDCVLIDEGQDWDQVRVDIVYQFFGAQNVVLSIGNNQIIENLDATLRNGDQWTTSVKREQRQQYALETSHRNKKNIVDFLNGFSNNSSYDWSLIGNNQLVGGRTLITSDYSYSLHKELEKDLQENENSFYDMMFLSGTTEQLDEIESIINSFGYKAFVALRPGKRNQMFPLDEFRVISYQACRGLEGWTVVCHEWDTFIEHTLKNVKSSNSDSVISNYTFMAMTRAIDSLVITLRNPESEISIQIINTARQLGGVCDVRV